MDKNTGRVPRSNQLTFVGRLGRVGAGLEGQSLVVGNWRLATVVTALKLPHSSCCTSTTVVPKVLTLEGYSTLSVVFLVT